MKKLIIVLAIVLSFGFAAPVFAETLYGVTTDIELSGFRPKITLILFDNIGKVENWLRYDKPIIGQYVFKIERIEVVIKEEEQPCYFIDKDGKKTEIECK